MRIDKVLLVAAVLCAIAAAVAVGARGAAGPPTIYDTLTNVVHPATTATAVAPANTGGGECFTSPGQACFVEWLMTRGTATATAYGVGPNGPVIGNPATATCSSTSCIKRAGATPSAGVTVEEWVVTGPNISVICTGPFC